MNKTIPQKIMHRLGKEWFLGGMVSMVVLATYFPDIGRAGGTLHGDQLADIGIAVVFFLHGLGLSVMQRQVIIFTHDIYFLCLLAEEAKQLGAALVTQSLTRRPEDFGIADPKLPFEGKNASKRIGALKAQQQAIAKLYKEGNEQEHHRQGAIRVANACLPRLVSSECFHPLI